MNLFGDADTVAGKRAALEAHCARWARSGRGPGDPPVHRRVAAASRRELAATIQRQHPDSVAP